MGRRGIKEYRAAEALALIAADRDQKTLVCPTCGSADIERAPPLGIMQDGGRVTLHCAACSRSATYLARSSTPHAPDLHRGSD